MPRYFKQFLIAFAIVTVASSLEAGEPFKPGKLPPADVAALQQGLTLRFYRDAKPLDARRVRLAALHVPADSPPTPFLAPGPFAAKLSGYLKNPLKGDYSFRLVGTGAITLKINDKLVLARANDKDVEVELAKNFNKIEIDYVSPAKGDATLRLHWQSEKFGFEPVPPEVLSSRGDDKDLVEQTFLREGRQLFANLQCAKCHNPAVHLQEPRTPMPELKKNGPDLDKAGSRFQLDWLAAWILEPRAHRRAATMPRVLHGVDAPKHAADIAAFLATLRGREPKSIDAKLKPADGEAIFKKFACNACHSFEDPAKKDELERLSLHHVGAKFARGALAEFLREPHARYPWTRMPDFKLTEGEAGPLETFLRDRAKGTVKPGPKGDAARGERLFEDIGCVRCHDGAIAKPKPFDLVKLKSLDQGCLANEPPAKAPHFGLVKAQRDGLSKFLKENQDSIYLETPAEFSQRQVHALQCASCHRRDGVLTRWHAVLEDEGKEPEKLPSLSWTGEKLKPEWTEKLLAGTHDHRARPWIKARMPAFPARAKMLAVGLSHEHGFGVTDDERPKDDAKLAAVGEKLIPQQGGFNCNNCHGVGKTPAIQPFEAPGINLLDAAVRLRYAYYQRWMLAPDRVDVTMRMPTFAMDGKTTQLREVFDGDARQQFDALWHYMQTLPMKNK